MERMTNDSTICPTCGTPCTVHSDGEGTSFYQSHYEFDAAVPLAELREENERLSRALAHYSITMQRWIASPLRAVPKSKVWELLGESTPTATDSTGGQDG